MIKCFLLAFFEKNVVFQGLAKGGDRNARTSSSETSATTTSIACANYCLLQTFSFQFSLFESRLRCCINFFKSRPVQHVKRVPTSGLHRRLTRMMNKRTKMRKSTRPGKSERTSTSSSENCAPWMRSSSQPAATRAATQDRIEILNFSIEFLDQVRNFHGFFKNFCKISGIFDEFGHF